MDGKTYYYAFDKDKILHICSGGYTNCGRKITEYYTEATEDNLQKFIEVCSSCQNNQKTADFITTGEFTTLEEEG